MFYKVYLSVVLNIGQWVGVAQPVQLLDTGWTVRGSNLRSGEIFCTHPDCSWGPPSLLYDMYQISLREVKRPDRGADRQLPSSAQAKERVQLYFYSVQAFMVCSSKVHCTFQLFNLLKPTSHVMHQQFNIQQLYVLPTLYLLVLYLSENKQRLVPLTA